MDFHYKRPDGEPGYDNFLDLYTDALSSRLAPLKGQELRRAIKGEIAYIDSLDSDNQARFAVVRKSLVARKRTVVADLWHSRRAPIQELLTHPQDEEASR